MKYRKLRIAWSAVCGIVCLLLIVFWVRSYWWADAVWYRPKTTTAFCLFSDEGAVRLGTYGNVILEMGSQPPIGWSQRHYWRDGYRSSVVDVGLWRKVFRGFRVPDRMVRQVPYWAFALAIATLTTAPWLLRRNLLRFSIRTLLIGMTLAAALLGAVVWAVR